MRGLIRRLCRENVLWSAETIYGHLVLLGFDPPFPAAKPEPVTGASRLVSIPVVGSLHHRYVRVAAYFPSLRDNPSEQKQNGPGLLKVGSLARHPELQNGSLAGARGPALVLNTYRRIRLPWGFSGGHGLE